MSVEKSYQVVCDRCGWAQHFSSMRWARNEMIFKQIDGAKLNFCDKDCLRMHLKHGIEGPIR